MPSQVSMDKRYADWIKAYVSRSGYVFGKCKDGAKEMAAAFPELTVVLGHVYCSWGKRGHAWLVNAEGTIVDPTASQFPDIFEYEPWKPGDTVRVGKCMECGEEIWEPVFELESTPPQRSVCGPECEAALTRAYG
jgi:hypothetical protein